MERAKYILLDENLKVHVVVPRAAQDNIII
jgi:hypothetical protein